MSEQSQVVHMMIRVSRLAAERWGMTLAQVMGVMMPADALGYILRNFGLFHMEGDEAVLDDVEEYLASKGVRISRRNGMLDGQCAREDHERCICR